MIRRLPTLAVLAAGLLIAAARPASADITVVARYQMLNGDTLTRSSYYTTKKIRTTLPNGDEIIYDNGSHRIALIDHQRRLFWEGPRAQADSIAARLRAERIRGMVDTMSAETRAQWNAVYTALTENVMVEKSGLNRKIAGYPCTHWVLRVDPYLTSERWVARALDVPDFNAEVEKVAQAAIRDPLGRGLMKLVVQARSTEGLALAGKLQVKTFEHQGTLTWEALQVKSERIGDEAWAIPEGYQRWEPPAATGE